MIDIVAGHRVESLLREIQFQRIAFGERSAVVHPFGLCVSLAKRLVVGGVFRAPSVDADHSGLRVTLGDGDSQRTAAATHIETFTALRKDDILRKTFDDLFRHLSFSVV